MWVDHSISRSWFKTELHYGRMWVDAVDSTCGTVGVIGWDGMDGLISTIHWEIMISMDGMIRWTITCSKTGMIRHENLGLVKLVDKNATLDRIHDPSRSMLDLGHISLQWLDAPLSLEDPSLIEKVQKLDWTR